MSDENQNERESMTPPDPFGPPEHCSKPWITIGDCVVAGLAVICGASLSLPLLLPCVGATRSSRLQKLGRQAEIENAWSELGLTDNVKTPRPEAM